MDRVGKRRIFFDDEIDDRRNEKDGEKEDRPDRNAGLYFFKKLFHYKISVSRYL